MTSRERSPLFANTQLWDNNRLGPRVPGVIPFAPPSTPVPTLYPRFARLSRRDTFFYVSVEETGVVNSLVLLMSNCFDFLCDRGACPRHLYRKFHTYPLRYEFDSRARSVRPSQNDNFFYLSFKETGLVNSSTLLMSNRCRTFPTCPLPYTRVPLALHSALHAIFSNRKHMKPSKTTFINTPRTNLPRVIPGTACTRRFNYPCVME